MAAVSQTLIFKTVDISTGNSDFTGFLHIQGNVPNGFAVKAEGDIKERPHKNGMVSMIDLDDLDQMPSE